MSGYPGGHAVFLLAALATHAAVGYTLGAVLFDRPTAGAAGALLPDVDFLFPAALGAPFVHRGLTHTALAAGVAVAVTAGLAAAVDAEPNRRVAGAVGVGYASHLLVDATTPAGVPLAFPLSSARVAVPLSGHSPAASAVLWSACLFALWYHRDPPGAESDPAREERR